MNEMMREALTREFDRKDAEIVRWEHPTPEMVEDLLCRVMTERGLSLSESSKSQPEERK